MRTAARLAILLGLLLGSGICAYADIEWTFNNVVFNNGDSVTGYFITNDAVTQYDSISAVVVSGPDSFTIAGLDSAYLPAEIGIFNSGWSRYIDLYMLSPLTSSGGIVPIKSGYDCPGCGTLLLAHSPAVVGVDLPEPSAVLVLFVALAGVTGGTRLLRRKRA
jgi:hypothetical protein